MSNMTPEQVAAKHAKRTKAAISEYTAGVQGVTIAPGAQAAKAESEMLAGIQEAVSSGKWARRVASVGLTEWQEKTLAKGPGRIAAGVDAALAKTIEFHRQRAEYQKTLDARLSGMPKLTLSDSIQRMIAQVEGMSEFEFKR